MTTRINWKLRKTADGYEGMIVLPVSLASITAARQRMPGAPPLDLTKKKMLMAQRMPVAVKAASSDPAGAVEKAVSAAESVLNNPLVQAALPPQAAAGIQAAKTALKIAQSGAVQDAGAAVKSGAKKLASAITSWF